MKKVIFHENSLEILQYEFQSSTVRDKPLVSVAQINEVNLNTNPISIVINHNEVIFIEDKYNKDFLEFVKRNNLKVENRFDIWAAINEDFLEAEFTSQHQERTFQSLQENGLSKESVIEIREKVQDLMKGWLSITWSFNYLGQYDLLLNKKQSFLLLFPRDFYWWTMDIALSNYPNKTINPYEANKTEN
ncbi:MAG: hypothetical protein EAZ85_04315 [Bacteroidetes bacterium]|nr:MAG: hypothetical protein EAZ85_04315 [Bacteroidota bacterium]TAG88386.1 MAG: hypothetical protein EAZ20_08665 [Bacteroidota bacterium]